ncbi:Syncytin-A [Merluccius polli]|uniref:Syncytin-A n=1 Tax=Merluccius polli TaxID=89951 RepID=A0AA47NBX0_MERPO|nr:Syncytin-A [Merluccius polli]KAK0156192.1 Syncytin-A [Merluccius polli]
MTHLTLGRMDLYWLCATDILRLRLPRHWSGTCTIVRLTVPVTVFVHTSNATNNTAPERARRDTTYPTSFDLTHNSPCYIDAIGIPRGVPNEYKLADQIGAGFENIPILSGLFPITPNKNVDRINYIHYNVQRLANLTRDAVEGISTQLAATSLMAFQNRVALDMLLAEKGGVCAMFGDQCCTFIPNNTAPDGSVTKALNGLRALSTELKEASGLDNPLEAWMQGLFGRWKALVMAVLTSLACFLAILITCGCCCIPCARTLCIRLIATTLSKENAPQDHDHQMVSLLIEPCQDCDDYYDDVTSHDDDDDYYREATMTVY